MGKEREQIAVQHQHPFVVNRPGELDFAVDAQQALVPGVGACRHANREAKAVIPQHDHAQAIDAGLDPATERHHTFPLRQCIEQPILGFAVTVHPRLAGRQHIRGLHFAGLTRARAGRAFHHLALDRRKHRALAKLVLRLTVAVLDEQGGGRCREMWQPPTGTGARHKHRGVPPGLRPRHKTVSHVHLAAESPGQLRIERLHRIKLLGRRHQHQFDFGTHLLRRQGYSRHRRIQHTRLLDLQATTAYKTPQPLPHRRIGQHIAQMKHQKPAMRTQQTARANPGEVGHEHVAVRFVFDAAKQLPVARVVFLHDGGTPQIVVVHRHIHPQTGQQVLQRLQPLVFIFGLGLKDRHMLQQVRLQPLKPGLQRQQLCRFRMHRLPDLLPLPFKQGPCKLALQSRQPFVAHMFQRARLFKKTGDFLAQQGFGLIDVRALLRTQCQGLAGRHRLARLVMACEHQVPLLAHQAEMPRLRKGVQFGIGPGLFGLVGLLQPFAFGLDIGLGQPSGDVGLQPAGQLHHALAQLPTFARGQTQGQRSLGSLCCMQVQQV